MRRTRAQQDETILEDRHFGAIYKRGSSHLDLPGLIGSWKIAEFSLDDASGGLHGHPFDDDPRMDVLPQGDEQFAGERHDCPLLETAAILLNPVLKPQGER